MKGAGLVWLGAFILRAFYSVIMDETHSKEWFRARRSSECRMAGRVRMKNLLRISCFSSLHEMKPEICMITLILQIKR